jgi:hypothetical protein
MAHLEAQETRSDPPGRLEAKSRLVRQLHDKGLSAEEVRRLFGLIDWLMHLSGDLEHD